MCKCIDVALTQGLVSKTLLYSMEHSAFSKVFAWPYNTQNKCRQIGRKYNTNLKF